MEVRIGYSFRISSLNSLILKPFVKSVDIEVLVVSDIGVTSKTIACPEFEEGDDILGLHEILIGDEPGERACREVADLVLRCKN